MSASTASQAVPAAPVDLSPEQRQEEDARLLRRLLSQGVKLPPQPKVVEELEAQLKRGEADVRAEYDRMKVQMARKEYRARHILVPSQEEAAKVLEQLKKGARFEDLARQYSIDTGSKANGGDLGFVDPAQLVPEFSGAMTKLAKGQITQTPVKSQFGWHIIQLTDTKEADFPALDAVRAQLEQQIQGQRFDAYIAKLKAQAKVQ